jgi:hypothetical protein
MEKTPPHDPETLDLWNWKWWTLGINPGSLVTGWIAADLARVPFSATLALACGEKCQWDAVPGFSLAARMPEMPVRFAARSWLWPERGRAEHASEGGREPGTEDE